VAHRRIRTLTREGEEDIVQGSDGTRYLRLENLDTSNGPLLKVWLSDAP
jgi:hypothetical protein